MQQMYLRKSWYRNKSNLVTRVCLVFIFSIPLALPAQSTYLQGQLVEQAGSRETGIPNITVSIPDFAWDITDDRGFFKLPLPAGRDFVTLTLDQSPMKILSPYEGLVNLPPDEPFRILVCGEENRRLTQKVADLNGRIARLQKDRQLSNRQLAGMHKMLLDTILHYENRIGALSESQQKSEVLSAEAQARNSRIRTLEDSMRVLVQALSVALEEKFLRQKQQYDRASAELLHYADRLKDLRDRATPGQLPLFFRSPQASAELTRTIGRYNEARAAILEHYEGNILVVRQNWENGAIAAQLEATYQFLLTNVHQAYMLPLDARVFGEIRRYEAKQSGRPKAEKAAARGAEELLPGLDAAIRALENDIAATLNALAKNI